MLKFDNIIRNLRLEEKVSLITNSGEVGNQKIPNYDFPQFSVVSKSKNTATNTILPTYTQLGQTWNEDLISECGEAVAQNAIYHKSHILIGVPTITESDVTDCFSDCRYLCGKLAAAYVRGVENGGAFACLDKAPVSLNLNQEQYRNEDFLATDIVLQEGKPRAIITEGLDCSELLNEMHFRGLRIAEVSTEADLIASIYKGNQLTIVEGFDAFNAVKVAIEKYKKAETELALGQISKAVFDSLQINGEILDIDRLDFAVDCLLFLLVSYNETLKTDGKPLTKEVLRKVAEESVVLLRNEKNALPIDTNVSIAIVGEYAVDPIVNRDTKKISSKYSPLSFYNKYGFNIVGHAYGYHSEVKNQEELIKEAIELGKTARYTIVYLGCREDEVSNYKLPQAQLDLVTRLCEEDVKMIGVISAPNNIDLSFVDKLEAAILTGPNTFETIGTAARVILGAVNPSGRLTFDVPYSIDENGKGSLGIKYPIGYGLSYTNFSYRQFKLVHNGIACFVENEGDIAGSDVVRLYVSKADDATGETKELKGFVKTTLTAHDYQKIVIPFDDFTFRTFDEKANCYGIKGGVYKVTLCGNGDEVIYETELKLDEEFANKNAYEFEVVKTNGDALDSFVNDNESKWDLFKNVRGIPLKKKLWIGSIAYAYLVILLLFLGFVNGGEVLYIFLGFVFLFTVYFIRFVRKSIDKEKKALAMITQHPINDMINNLDDFRVAYTEEYAVNDNEHQIVIEREEEVEEVEVKQPTATEEKVEEVYEYVSSEYNLKEDTVEYSNDVDLGVLCNNFNDYALKNGLIVEQPSIRLLISAICSSKLVFLRSARMDLLPKLVSVLNSFLGNDEFMFDVNEVQNNSLIWKLENGKYVHTDLVRALHQAKKYRKHLNILAFNNVKVETLNDYFADFYKYCKAPMVPCEINFGKDKPQLFTMPHNITFVMIPETSDYLDNISKDVAVNSFSIELQIRENELIREEEVVVKRYPFHKFVGTIEAEKQHLRLHEESWKKLDDFEETLAMDGKFRVENKTVLQIESFVSAILACGADDTEAFDAALASKIIPTTRSYELNKPGKVDNVIKAAIERHFEVDMIPTTLRALKKSN